MGININGINITNVMLISIYRTYSKISWFPLPNVISVPLAIKLIGITKHRQFFMRGIWSSFCKFRSLRTSYHSNTEWILYQIKISHLRTVWILKLHQSWSQQSAWPSNFPHVWRSLPVCKIMTLMCCSVFFCCKKLNHEKPIISHKKNQWYESNYNSNICNTKHLHFKLV